jgi:hypothetical protein
MHSVPKIHRAIIGYFTLSSSVIGTTEFIHDFNRYKASSLTSIQSTIMATPGFFFGAILGPAFPIFYLAGVKALDWKRCPKLK